ncbi:MAG: hypothetical protein QF704_13215 [Anaerolineales bacterium]|nr:hypothetical protein [Anaerolineales bacterium]
MKAIRLLSSVDTFKGNIEKTSTTNDNILFNLISQSTSDMERYTGRRLRGRTYGANGLEAEYHNGVVTNKLYVNEYPIISVSSLYDDVNREFTNTSLKAPTEYMLWKDQGIVQLYNDATNGSVFSKGIGNIKLIYTAGYDDFEIITGINDSVDFNDGTSRTVTIPSGTYTSIDLANEVGDKMDGVSTDDISCRYDNFTSKYTIISDGTVLTMNWATGTNWNGNIGRTMGFDTTADDASVLSYTSDYSVLGVPAELEQACLELTLQKFEESRFGSNRFGVKTVQTIGQHAGMTTYESPRLPQSVERVLKLYKRVIV